MVENTFGNSNKDIHTHYKAIKQQYGKVKNLGLDRFTTLLSCFSPSIDQLSHISNLFHDTFSSFINSIDMCVIDESLIGYEPKKQSKEKAETMGEPIPVVFIPRKPHPNGLLIYQATTFILDPVTNSHLPFIIDLLHHLCQGLNSKNFFEKF